MNSWACIDFRTGFPWKDLPDGAKVVDVGGNVGSVSLVVAKQYPQLKFVVQDRPDVVTRAASVNSPMFFFRDYPNDSKQDLE